MSCVLVIAGVDSSGGAGLVRDVATLSALGLRAVCAVTAVTVQTDTRFIATHAMTAQAVAAQIEAASGRYAAVKIGMLAQAAIVEAVAASVPPRERCPVVVDPVLASSSGGSLLEAAGVRVLLERLLPNTTVLTPNIPEAALLLGAAPAQDEVALVAQARALLQLGPEAVLIKGGHGTGERCRDLLLHADAAPYWFDGRRLGAQARGTGCALASAIAAGLAARQPLVEAVRRARDHVRGLLGPAA
ncbi:MAG: hydroxymethylpyrimidine/phosphomethylpyrimidine kinase [Proteobacteria bacterium]|nr:hydroxymethylpyrimidine/phosphomethylpyrimidine kinase [Pseudomonadota bacterium]